MNLATIILPQRIVEALGWTLFHSLWQGALAALAFAVILYFSRRASSRMRYGLGLAILALMLLTSALTFQNHYRAAGPAAVPLRPAMAAPTPAYVTLPLVQAMEQEPSRLQRISAFFSDYFSRHLPLLVTLWLLGVLFLTLRFSGTLLYLQRLKYKQNRLLPPPWPERLQHLAEKAGLQRPLLLLESLRLKTPVVVGHLKPVLLLPAGLVSGLPMDEVEALLAHEIAHVMRRDYLVNVLQNLVEILYFFHPGLRWISAAVRQEREHCCDDFAVALCGDAQNYARALARLQVDGVACPEPALAAVGRPQRLLQRLVRLLAPRSGPRTAYDFREGFVSALLVIFGLFGMLKLAAVTAGGVPVGEAAAGSFPVSAVGQEQKAQKAADVYRVVRFAFTLKEDGEVKLTGTVPSGLSEPPGTWILRVDDGGLVWLKFLETGKSAGGATPYSEAVSLKRGVYRWYLPAGCSAAAQLKNAGAWTELKLMNGIWEYSFERRRDAEGKLLPLRLDLITWLAEMLADERVLNMETRQLQEKEKQKQLEAGSLLQEEVRLKREEELRLRAEKEKQRQEEITRILAEKQLSEEERRKLEKELQEQAEAELKLKELELKQQHALLRANEMMRQAELAKETLRVQEQGALSQLEQTLAQDKLMRAEEQRLRMEAQRLRVEEKNFQALITELTASGAVGKLGRYEVKLSTHALLVNGKKQPPAVHERVKKFFEKQFNTTLTNERTFQYVND